MPRKMFTFAFVVVLASASLAEAGLFGGCGRGAAGRRGLFGRRAAVAAPYGQVGYSATTYSSYGYTAPVVGYSATYSYGASCSGGSCAVSLPAPATYVAPVAPTPQIEGFTFPSKSLPLPSDRRTEAPWLKAPAAPVSPF